MISLSRFISTHRRQLKTAGHIPYILVRTLLLFGLGFIIVYPLMQQGSTMFMTREDINDPLVVWIPNSLTLENVKLALEMLDFRNSILVTIFYCTTMVFLQLISSALTGYGFARLSFPGSRILFMGVLLTIIVPPQIIILPLYINFKNFDILGIIKLLTGEPLNMINSPVSLFILALTGMGLKGGLYIYIFHQFFKGIPTAMEEASLIDGAGIWRTFRQIILPNSRGSIITVALFSFVWQYNDIYFTSLFYPRGNLISLKLIRVSMSVGEYINRALNEMGITVEGINPLFSSLIASTAALITVLPLITIYLFVQRQFTEGVEHAGIKG